MEHFGQLAPSRAFVLTRTNGFRLPRVAVAPHHEHMTRPRGAKQPQTAGALTTRLAGRGTSGRTPAAR